MPSLEPNILLVDDYPAGRVATRAALERFGFAVREAADGAEALAGAREPTDLVLLDVNLPDMNGFEVCRRLKTDPQTRHLPVLHLSADRVDPLSRAVGLEAGADGYLVHPVEPRVLAATIHSTLRARAAEEAARRERDLLRVVLDTLPVSVWIVDEAGKITHANPAGQALLGGPALGVAPQSLLTAEKGGRPEPADRWPLALALSSRQTCDDVLELCDAQGQTHTVVQIAAPIAGDGAVVVCRDISDQKTAERRLLAAQRMDAVGRLAGGIAHELNNALTAILLHAAEIVRSSTAPADIAADARAIVCAGDAAARLTQKLLAYGRRQMLRPERVDLGGEIRELEPLLVHAVGEQFQLSLELAPRVAPVRLDRVELARALVDLVVNARDALGSAGTIRIATAQRSLTGHEHAEARPGPYAEIAVSDDGPGMDANTLAQVFEPFVTTKGVGQGPGLGLSMVFGFAAQSGGFATAESKPGAGTTIRLFVPSRITASKLAVAPPQLRCCVLLVDDDPQVRALVASVLGEEGYQVVVAANGREALARVECDRLAVDVLISDVVMPCMSGPELARRLAERGQRFETLLISGYGMPPRDTTLEAWRWLDKPFDPEVLLATLDELTAQRKAP